MKWIITEDIIDFSKKTWGTCDLVDIPAVDRCRFRLLDSDEMVYFRGYLSKTDLYKADGEEAFEPLDTVGASYGCTDLQYWENGWRTL